MADHEHPVWPDQVAAARKRVLSVEESTQVASLLSLLADPVRARILDALDAVPELCVGDLALVLDASEDSVGYALRILRTAGFVSTRREGRMVFYRLAPGFPEPLFDHCLRLLSALPRDAMEDA
ncbi:MAG: metalloregulator ArsR/SmtB family transcription factor [bacterium]|jgi:DNA-binding transcriptional ArsR family regulator|nr:metalloregulator ArsR/SmtB family transcription factor [bacterium]